MRSAFYTLLTLALAAVIVSTGCMGPAGPAPAPPAGPAPGPMPIIVPTPVAPYGPPAPWRPWWHPHRYWRGWY